MRAYTLLLRDFADAYDIYALKERERLRSELKATLGRMQRDLQQQKFMLLQLQTLNQPSSLLP